MPHQNDLKNDFLLVREGVNIGTLPPPLRGQKRDMRIFTFCLKKLGGRGVDLPPPPPPGGPIKSSVF